MSKSQPLAALSAEQLSVLADRLAELRTENETDLQHASDTIASLAAEHATVDPTVREVLSNAEYMVEDATEVLKKITKAQADLENGSYGLCSVCGQPIAFERLELRPYIPTCIACSK